MSRARALASLTFTAALVLAGCDKAERVAAPSPAQRALDAAVGARMGGTGTCLVLVDAATGESRYQYGRYTVCTRQLPPCATFDIPSSLIAIDAGLVTPQTRFKWNGEAQPVRAWEKDADLASAFRQSIPWWFQRLAQQIGAARFAERLKAFAYGNAETGGPPTDFWNGLAAGGQLEVSTRDQADFLQRLYAGRLPVKAESASAVEALMAPQPHGPAVITGKTGACTTSSDGSRQVGWWVGRFKSPERDLVFAASMEGETAPPASEVQSRVEAVFADVGYLPAP